MSPSLPHPRAGVRCDRGALPVPARRLDLCSSQDWIKVNNPKSPAMNRAKDAFS